MGRDGDKKPGRDAPPERPRDGRPQESLAPFSFFYFLFFFFFSLTFWPRFLSSFLFSLAKSPAREGLVANFV